MVTTTCGYCKRTWQRSLGSELEADAAGILCCDDCYDEDNRRGKELPPAVLTVQQAVTVHHAMWLRAIAAIDSARAAEDMDAYLKNMEVIAESADVLRALEPGLPASLSGTRTAWFTSELVRFVRDLEETGRDRYWIGPQFSFLAR